MSFGIRLLMGLAALLMTAGVAAAQCPECDPDGAANSSGSYSSIDVGAITEHATTLVDTDMSVSDEDDPKGFWAWFSFCLTAVLDGLEDALGIDLGLQASTDVYVSEHGVDLDAIVNVTGPACDALTQAGQACKVDFDETEMGDLDDQTWGHMGDAHSALGQGAMTGDLPLDGEALDGVDVDQCVAGDLTLATC